MDTNQSSILIVHEMILDKMGGTFNVSIYLFLVWFYLKFFYIVDLANFVMSMILIGSYSYNKYDYNLFITF